MSPWINEKVEFVVKSERGSAQCWVCRVEEGYVYLEDGDGAKLYEAPARLRELADALEERFPSIVVNEKVTAFLQREAP